MINSLPITTIPAEDEALRQPVRDFLAKALPAIPFELRVQSWMGCDASFSRALATHDWLGLTLPTEYRGGGRSPFARMVVVEDCWSRTPGPSISFAASLCKRLPDSASDARN